MDGLLARQPRDPFHTDSRAEFLALRARKIRGILRDSGRGILLFDVARGAARHSSYTISVEGFSAAQCLISDQQFDDPINQPAFSYINADLKGFEGWLRSSAIGVKSGKTLVTAKYRKPKRITYRLPNGRLLFSYHLTGSHQGGRHPDLTWSESTYIRFRPNKPISMDATIEWHRWLQDLMILLTDSNYCLEWPEVRWGKHDCTLYFQRLTSKAEPPRLHECATNFPDLQESFGTLFGSWKTVRETYGPAVYLYLGTRRGMELYTENQFIMMISGLEAFHRTKYGDPKSRRASAKLDKIVGQISDDKEKQWVAERLAYTTMPNLEQRIFETLNALPLGFDKKRLRTFAEECAKLRNDLAHYGGHRSKTTAYTDFVSSLQKKINAISPLYHALILIEIGLDPNAVRTWATESLPAFRRRWYFAEAGLMDG